MFRHVAKRLPPQGWVWIALILPFLVRAIYHLLQSGHPQFPIGNNDPDSWLRLTLVREWLQGGGWYNHAYASDAPYSPTVSPWTRPLDLVIALLVKLQAYQAPLELKLLRAAICLPVLWWGLVSAGCLRLMQRLCDRTIAYVLLGAFMLTSPLLFNYFSAYNADHHAPLTALWVWLLYFQLDPRPWRSAAISGILLALMLWISPEAITLIAAIYGYHGLRWLRGEQSAQPLMRLSAVTCLGAALAMMAERPPGEWNTPLYDTLSISYVLALAAAAFAVALLHSLPLATLRQRLSAAIVVGACALGLLWLNDPVFFHGPLAAVDPYIKTNFHPHIGEAMSPLMNDLAKAIAFLIVPLGAVQVIYLMRKKPPAIIAADRIVWLEWLMLTTAALYMMQQRWSYYCYPLAMLILSAWLAGLFLADTRGMKRLWPGRALRRMPASRQSLMRIGAVALFLVCPLMLPMLGGNDPTPEGTERRQCLKDARRIIQNGELAQLGNGKALNVFAPTDNGAEILFFTPHHIIASNYHREGPGIRDIWETEKEQSLAAVHAVLTRRKVDAVLLCPTLNSRKDSALYRLFKGELHAGWLAHVPLKTKGLSETPPAIFLVR